MPAVYYIDKFGERHAVDVPVGYTLMEGAYNRQLPGMVAECGGGAACGTCHSYVSAAWVERLPPIEDLEESMLYLVDGRRDNSRLACQIHMSEDLAGIELEIANNG